MKEIKPSEKNLLNLTVIEIFIMPAIAMLAWGAFLSMSEVGFPAFGYWEFFMLNVVAGILRKTQITKWIIKEKSDNRDVC